MFSVSKSAKKNDNVLSQTNCDEMNLLPSENSDFPTKNKVGNPNWVKGGSSPNPFGRPKSSFGKLIRKRTKDGAKLVEYVLKVFSDERNDAKLRLEACTWLADRGWGKPGQSVELGMPEGSFVGGVVVLPALSEGSSGKVSEGVSNEE